jgi:hypothetical protein
MDGRRRREVTGAIVATADRALRPEWCRNAAASRLDAEIIDIDAGHCPHVGKAEVLAAILDQVAACF